MPATDIDGVSIIAETLRKTLAASPSPALNGVTARIGIASDSLADHSNSDVITRADYAHYQSKGAGRSRAKKAANE